MSETTVHLMRHGEVHNPAGVLYGRLAGYNLSELGHEMAETVAESLQHCDITYLVASPLERAQQTAGPLAESLALPIHTDERVIEAANKFEGKTFGVGAGALRRPSNWPLVWNPLRPSWGEPYKRIAARMRLAIGDARVAARGHEAVIVSHQLPIWIARRSYEKGGFVHDPRKRECTLASLTSLTFSGDTLVSLRYSEPAGHLLPDALRGRFAGGA